MGGTLRRCAERRCPWMDSVRHIADADPTFLLPEAAVVPGFCRQVMRLVHGHGPICTVRPCG